VRIGGTRIVLALAAAASLLAAAEPDTATEHYLHGRFQAAAEVLERTARSQPASAEASFWLGKTYLRLHRRDEAVAALERAVQLEPSNSVKHLWLGRAYGEKASHAFKLTAFGLARKVRQEFETAVRLDPANMEARFDLLEFYVEAPGIVGGGSDKAEAQAAEIASRSPERGHAARARIHRHKKEWPQALEEYERARAAAPKAVEPCLDLADYLLERNDFERAAAAAAQALALRPTSPRAKLLAAAADVSRGVSLAEAEKTLRALAAGPLGDSDPSFAEVHYWLGRAAQARGDRTAATAAFKTALVFEPDWAKPKEALSGLP
jgi:tetratricopeptide (TPR) repeat protein